MSAKSRSKHRIDLPLKHGDYIIGMHPTTEHEILVTTQQGRHFVVRRVARYKRPFKVHEVHANGS